MGRLFAPKSAPAPEPEKQPAAPPALTEDKVKAMVDGALSGTVNELRGTIGQLTERITELATRQPQVIVQPGGQAPVAQAHPGISDEDLDQAVLHGQGAAARIRQLVDRAVAAATDRVIKEHVEPLRAFGAESLANLSHEVSMTKMPYYQKYKKEIDAGLGALDPTIRANPAALKMIHDAVVGAHANDLITEAGEAAVRKAQEDAQREASGGGGAASAGGGAGRGGSRPQPEMPTAEALGGQDALAALAHKGQGGGQNQDEFARGLGYKDWGDYIKQYEALVEAETKGNA